MNLLLLLLLFIYNFMISFQFNIPRAHYIKPLKMSINNYRNFFELPKKERIVVIGDVHGDMNRLLKVLVNAKIINKNFDWIAEPRDTTILQLGDQIDDLRIKKKEIKEWCERPDFSVILLTDFLHELAIKNGGNFISLIGNHELLNTVGDFTYVSYKNRVSYRKELFKPNGYFSRILAKRPIVVKIGDYLFCHGGITIKHLNLLEKYNKNIYYLNNIWKKYILNIKLNYADMILLNELLFDKNSILWTRNMNDNIINNNNIVNNKLNLKYTIVGHTIVPEITLKNESIWYVDTALSKKYGKHNFQYLDIINDEFNIKTIYDYNKYFINVETIPNNIVKIYYDSLYDDFYKL